MVEEVRMGPKEDKSQTNEPNIGRDREDRKDGRPLVPTSSAGTQNY